MTNPLVRMKRFFRELHQNEEGPGTVEWMLLIIVALVVLAAIYYFVQWAIQGTTEAAKAVEGEY